MKPLRPPERPEVSSERFPLLFAPLALGGLTLRNRIVLLPMGLKFTNRGTPTDDDVAFYEARAAAGVGLIVTGGTIVHVSSALRGQRQLEAFRRDNVPAFARIAAAVHRHGGHIFGQLFHRGREAIGDSDGPLWGPSASRSPTTPQIPHPLSRTEIADLVSAFATSARNLIDAGYDGIELHGAHGYLVGSFLSPHANQREDDYGGSLENRLRFVLEIAAAVRDRCGAVPLGVRLSAKEEIEGGLEPAEAHAVAEALAHSGLVTYLSVAVGVRGGYVKDMSHPNGLAVPLAAGVRAASGLPVIASQRITHPTLAEEVLASGAADLVGMARAHIADARWTTWARSGDLDRIVPCIGCLQDCRAAAGGISCVHNPVSGRERELGVLPRIRQPRRVAVVGGGPAGMEAARVTAEGGHEVVLFEAARRLGGQVALAATAPNRAEVDGVVSFREGELHRLGVEVRLGATATAEVVLEQEPHAVVVATGATQAEPPFFVDGDARVETSWTLFRDDLDLAGIESAVVIDDGRNGWETYSASELLAERGVRVTVVVSGTQIASGIPTESVGPLLRRLRNRAVELQPMTAVSAVEKGAVSVFDPFRLAARHILEERILASDLTVLCGPKQPDDRLHQALLGRISPLFLVGDGATPRGISQAVLDGHRVARQVLAG